MEMSCAPFGWIYMPRYLFGTYEATRRILLMHSVNVLYLNHRLDKHKSLLMSIATIHTFSKNENDSNKTIMYFQLCSRKIQMLLVYEQAPCQLCKWILFVCYRDWLGTKVFFTLISLVIIDPEAKNANECAF